MQYFILEIDLRFISRLWYIYLCAKIESMYRDLNINISSEIFNTYFSTILHSNKHAFTNVYGLSLSCVRLFIH